jgi:hypothetical protein
LPMVRVQVPVFIENTVISCIFEEYPYFALR